MNSAASGFRAVWVCSAQEQVTSVTSRWASSEQICGLHRSTWFQDEPLLFGAPNQTQGGCYECKRLNIKMLRHISNTKLQFSTFFKDKFKKFKMAAFLLLQEKTTIQRRQAFQQHAAILSSLPYQECLTGKFSKGIVCQLDWALSTLIIEH